MLTVARSIDAPIKLLFPVDWAAVDAETGEPKPQFSLLGLGDIVIPGVFIALCLRFDILKRLDAAKANALVEKGEADEVLRMIQRNAATAPTHYFYGCLVGYLVAIAATVIVM